MNVLRTVLLPMLCVVIPGCGEGQVPTYPVSGTVVFEDGSAVRTGTVELESTEHKLSASGRIRDDGSFELGTYTTSDGACAGEHRAIVVQLIINDGTVRHTKSHGKPVDPMYASYSSSPLRATVEARESNTLKLVVKSRPSAR